MRDGINFGEQASTRHTKWLRYILLFQLFLCTVDCAPLGITTNSQAPEANRFGKKTSPTLGTDASDDEEAETTIDHIKAYFEILEYSEESNTSSKEKSATSTLEQNKVKEATFNNVTPVVETVKYDKNEKGENDRLYGNDGNMRTHTLLPSKKYEGNGGSQITERKENDTHSNASEMQSTIKPSGEQHVEVIDTNDDATTHDSENVSMNTTRQSSEVHLPDSLSSDWTSLPITYEEAGGTQINQLNETEMILNRTKIQSTITSRRQSPVDRINEGEDVTKIDSNNFSMKKNTHASEANIPQSASPGLTSVPINYEETGGTQITELIESYMISNTLPSHSSIQFPRQPTVNEMATSKDATSPNSNRSSTISTTQASEDHITKSSYADRTSAPIKYGETGSRQITEMNETDTILNTSSNHSSIPSIGQPNLEGIHIFKDTTKIDSDNFSIKTKTPASESNIQQSASPDLISLPTNYTENGGSQISEPFKIDIIFRKSRSTSTIISTEQSKSEGIPTDKHATSLDADIISMNTPIQESEDHFTNSTYTDWTSVPISYGETGGSQITALNETDMISNSSPNHSSIPSSGQPNLEGIPTDEDATSFDFNNFSMISTTRASEDHIPDSSYPEWTSAPISYGEITGSQITALNETDMSSSTSPSHSNILSTGQPYLEGIPIVEDTTSYDSNSFSLRSTTGASQDHITNSSYADWTFVPISYGEITGSQITALNETDMSSSTSPSHSNILSTGQPYLEGIPIVEDTTSYDSNSFSLRSTTQASQDHITNSTNVDWTSVPISYEETGGSQITALNEPDMSSSTSPSHSTIQSSRQPPVDEIPTGKDATTVDSNINSMNTPTQASEDDFPETSYPEWTSAPIKYGETGGSQITALNETDRRSSTSPNHYSIPSSGQPNLEGIPTDEDATSFDFTNFGVISTTRASEDQIPESSYPEWTSAPISYGEITGSQVVELNETDMSSNTSPSHSSIQPSRQTPMDGIPTSEDAPTIDSNINSMNTSTHASEVHIPDSSYPEWTSAPISYGEITGSQITALNETDMSSNTSPNQSNTLSTGQAHLEGIPTVDDATSFDFNNFSMISTTRASEDHIPESSYPEWTSAPISYGEITGSQITALNETDMSSSTSPSHSNILSTGQAHLEGIPTNEDATSFDLINFSMISTTRASEDHIPESPSPEWTSVPIKHGETGGSQTTALNETDMISSTSPSHFSIRSPRQPQINEIPAVENATTIGSNNFSMMAKTHASEANMPQSASPDWTSVPINYGETGGSQITELIYTDMISSTSSSQSTIPSTGQPRMGGIPTVEDATKINSDDISMNTAIESSEIHIPDSSYPEWTSAPMKYGETSGSHIAELNESYVLSNASHIHSTMPSSGQPPVDGISTNVDTTSLDSNTISMKSSTPASEFHFPGSSSPDLTSVPIHYGANDGSQFAEHRENNKFLTSVVEHDPKFSIEYSYTTSIPELGVPNYGRQIPSDSSAENIGMSTPTQVTNKSLELFENDVQRFFVFDLSKGTTFPSTLHGPTTDTTIQPASQPDAQTWRTATEKSGNSAYSSTRHPIWMLCLWLTAWITHLKNLPM